MSSTHLLRAFHLRPGEVGRAMWVGLIGVAYAAATALGDDIAQTVFVTRVGAQSMPIVFLFKGLLDVVAAAVYLPIARGRSAGRVWHVALSIYVATVIAGWLVVAGGSPLSAYALFIGHECAWTILTIHWGVFILEAFDASQARRLFPLLFTAARVGGIFAGVVLKALAGPIGVTNLLFGAAGCAALAGLASYVGGRRWIRPADWTEHPASSMAFPAEAPDQAQADDDLEAADPGGRSDARDTAWRSWRRAATSPLVQIIAWSTAAMVLVRYGLYMVAIDKISLSFANDKEMVAEFLGLFGAAANAVSIVLGVFVVPKVLARLGVGFANLAYATATVISYGALLVFPSLGAAALARFTRVQFKDALKTPLSTLFYGAEPPHRRAPARAFIFGVAIPAATVVTALTLEAGARCRDDLLLVTGIGLVASSFFFLACAVQNRRWRKRLVELLRWKLERAPPPRPERLEETRALIEPHSRQADAKTSALLDDVARGFASADSRVRAVAEEVLAEAIPRMRAHRIASTARNED